MSQNIFGKFSDNLKKVLILSEETAREQNVPIDTEHQLLALLTVKDSLAYEILSSLNISAERIRLSMSFMLSEKTTTAMTNDGKDAIQNAVKIASKNGHSLVDCEHLLLALIANNKFNSYSLLDRAGPTTIRDIKTRIEAVFSNNKEAPRENQSQAGFETNFMPGEMPMDEPFDMGGAGGFGPSPVITRPREKKESFLELFTINLTAKAAKGELDPVVGRNEETERIVQILSRRTKNNPILIGEPGVGKTSIVEGLAQKITEGQVPSRLHNKEILSLDMGSVIAGTMYRGQFESRIKKILAEVKKKGNVILFIDEIHTVVGAGSTEGSIDAANLLKPMLARGELRLIGSTTFDEYKKHIEKDAAFERRFQPVKVPEPTVIETIAILNGIKRNYEKHHNVKYTTEAIKMAAELSKRYIADRFLPDKAIDLIDEAAAAVDKVTAESIRLAKLKKKLKEVLRKKEDLIFEERYEEATLLREKEIKLENEIRSIQAPKREKIIIDAENIASIVSRQTGIPVTTLNTDEKRKILDLEKRLSERVVGQDDAIKEVAKAVKRARVGISNPNRPTGSFIFLGPTGVGKSELAKVLARELLGNENALVKIDMSEFMERHNVSRLVGAPAGYVGYEEGGKLTEIVRKNPHTIILLDEIEKAHPEVFNILLQIMEDGVLTDAKGRHVSFKNTIIIMTSNLGTDVLRRQASIGFGASNNDLDQYEKLSQNVRETVEKHFKPEFINRLDKIVIFKPLDKESIRKIVEIQLGDFKKRLEHSKIKFKYTADVRNWIAEKGFDPNFGARPIRRVISEEIETPITDMILEEKLSIGGTASLSIKDNHIVIK